MISVAKYYEYINSVLSVLKSLGGSARPSEVCTAFTRDLERPDSVLEERERQWQQEYDRSELAQEEAQLTTVIGQVRQLWVSV